MTESYNGPYAPLPDPRTLPPSTGPLSGGGYATARATSPTAIQPVKGKGKGKAKTKARRKAKRKTKARR